MVRKAALSVTATTDVLEADGYLLGTPANLGYIGGALKHAFDTIYYPCLDETRGRPYGLFLHANGAARARCGPWSRSPTGLAWVKSADHVVLSGKPGKQQLEECWNLGATVAAQLMR